MDGVPCWKMNVEQLWSPNFHKIHKRKEFFYQNSKKYCRIKIIKFAFSELKIQEFFSILGVFFMIHRSMGQSRFGALNTLSVFVYKDLPIPNCTVETVDRLAQRWLNCGIRHVPKCFGSSNYRNLLSLVFIKIINHHSANKLNLGTWLYFI